MYLCITGYCKSYKIGNRIASRMRCLVILDTATCLRIVRSVVLQADIQAVPHESCSERPEAAPVLQVKRSV